MYPCSPSPGLPLLSRPVNGPPGLKSRLGEGQHRPLCRGGNAEAPSSRLQAGSPLTATAARAAPPQRGWPERGTSSGPGAAARAASEEATRGEHPPRGGDENAAGKRRRALRSSALQQHSSGFADGRLPRLCLRSTGGYSLQAGRRPRRVGRPPRRLQPVSRRRRQAPRCHGLPGVRGTALPLTPAARPQRPSPCSPARRQACGSTVSPSAPHAKLPPFLRSRGRCPPPGAPGGAGRGAALPPRSARTRAALPPPPPRCAGARATPFSVDNQPRPSRPLRPRDRSASGEPGSAPAPARPRPFPLAAERA